jgi:hypothetical protein
MRNEPLAAPTEWSTGTSTAAQTIDVDRQGTEPSPGALRATGTRPTNAISAGARRTARRPGASVVGA